VLAQVRDVRLAAEEPQQFVDHGLQVHFLGGHERKALPQVEAHLVPEHGERAGAGAVGLAGAVLAHMAQQRVVLLHDAQPAPVARRLPEGWLRR
jgi:hypothetical protein